MFTQPPDNRANRYNIAHVVSAYAVWYRVVMCVVILMLYLGTVARCEGCPWNDLMVACWQEDPEKRPSFQEIVDGATSILEDMGGAPPAPDVMGALVIGAWCLVFGVWRLVIPEA